MSPAKQTVVDGPDAGAGSDGNHGLRHLIEHAAHLLPAQGPITAFIHHNTLHAFEHLPFEQAVVEGGRVFGCHPFLPEERYREQLNRGRIRPEDIEAVLLDDLGDRADDLLGFLGTRFSLRQTILRFPLHDGPNVDLAWVIAESDALRCIRDDSPPELRERLLDGTRRWIMGEFRGLANGHSTGGSDGQIDPELSRQIHELLDQTGAKRIESWPERQWESFVLGLLWQICEFGVRQAGAPVHESDKSPGNVAPHQVPEKLEELTGNDPHEPVNELLIRFCAAFLDQGFGAWKLPGRDLGFWNCFLTVHGQADSPEAWRKGLAAELTGLRLRNVDPEESIRQSLHEFGLEPEQAESMINSCLLPLRGFAGMLWQLETRGDRVFHPAPAGTLVGYVAVRLLLQKYSTRHQSRMAGLTSDLMKLPVELEGMVRRSADRTPQHLRDAYRVFELAQLLGWPPRTLARLRPVEWRMVFRELHDFDGIERRRVYHLAYEHKYRNETLDAISVHSRRVRELRQRSDEPDQPAGFQVVCCIDEREESFRRALEEVAPHCETFGTAGFFRVPIYYRGAADAHFTPLCPVVIQPKHYVREEVVEDHHERDHRRKNVRRTIGTITHRVHVGSRTFTGGWVGTVLLGTLATFPLVARILFPRLTARLRGWFGKMVRPPAETRLRLERASADPGDSDGSLGFSVPEMASTVELLLRDMGLTAGFSEIVVITGHGSSSLNNPHESAHDCGACGGGRGGPNARAFASMANDPRVRAIVERNGLKIPDQTVFIGAYHNTCDDSFTCYDLDRVPESHRARLQLALTAIDEARARSAHERSRRFETAPLDLSIQGGLKHVENRAEDLSQVRPEYGHATNALCFVGNRKWSRGLYLDRRAFLQSYDSRQDDEGSGILNRILQAVIPVCGGISLEYYFSYVDPVGYGCGTKLPHNITSLLGVMNGAASDLRTGLPWQMVEIHEPVRLLFVIETTPAAMQGIIRANEQIARFVEGGWVQLAVFDPASLELQLYRNGQFYPYQVHDPNLDVAPTSLDWYRGWRDHLRFASIGDGFSSFIGGVASQSR